MCYHPLLFKSWILPYNDESISAVLSPNHPVHMIQLNLMICNSIWYACAGWSRRSVLSLLLPSDPTDLFFKLSPPLYLLAKFTLLDYLQRLEDTQYTGSAAARCDAFLSMIILSHVLYNWPIKGPEFCCTRFGFSFVCSGSDKLPRSSTISLCLFTYWAKVVLLSSDWRACTAPLFEFSDVHMLEQNLLKLVAGHRPA